MSREQTVKCRCGRKIHKDHADLVVIRLKQTPRTWLKQSSVYSRVYCLRCNGEWTTNASYVDSLPTMDSDDARREWRKREARRTTLYQVSIGLKDSWEDVDLPGFRFQWTTSALSVSCIAPVPESGEVAWPSDEMASIACNAIVQFSRRHEHPDDYGYPKAIYHILSFPSTTYLNA